MRPVKPDPVRLGNGHCCDCTAAHGGVCGHIGGPFACHQHLTIRAMRIDWPSPWWLVDDSDEYRPPEVCWD